MTQLDLLAAWGFHKIMSLIVSLMVKQSVDEVMDMQKPTKTPKKKSANEVASIARGFRDARRVQSSVEDLIQSDAEFLN